MIALLFPCDWADIGLEKLWGEKLPRRDPQVRVQESCDARAVASRERKARPELSSLRAVYPCCLGDSPKRKLILANLGIFLCSLSSQA